MIEAFANGVPLRIAPYAGRAPVGFTRPWAHHGIALAGHPLAGHPRLTPPRLTPPG
jgi:hypothetical protein